MHWSRRELRRVETCQTETADRSDGAQELPRTFNSCGQIGAREQQRTRLRGRSRTDRACTATNVPASPTANVITAGMLSQSVLSMIVGASYRSSIGSLAKPRITPACSWPSDRSSCSGSVTCRIQDRSPEITPGCTWSVQNSKVSCKLCGRTKLTLAPLATHPTSISPSPLK